MIRNPKDFLKTVIEDELWSKFSKTQNSIIRQVDGSISTLIEDGLEAITSGKFSILLKKLSENKTEHASEFFVGFLFLQLKFSRSNENFKGGSDLKQETFGNKLNTLDLLAFIQKGDIPIIKEMLKKSQKVESIISLHYTVKGGKKRSLLTLIQSLTTMASFFDKFISNKLSEANTIINTMDENDKRVMDIKGNFYPTYYAFTHKAPISEIFSKIKKLIPIKDIVFEDIPIRVILNTDNNYDTLNEIDGVFYNQQGDIKHETYREMSGATVGGRGGKNTIDIYYNDLNDLAKKTTLIEIKLIK